MVTLRPCSLLQHFYWDNFPWDNFPRLCSRPQPNFVLLNRRAIFQGFFRWFFRRVFRAGSSPVSSSSAHLDTTQSLDKSQSLSQKGQRIAVLVLPADRRDVDVANNLTELVIAHLASHAEKTAAWQPPGAGNLEFREVLDFASPGAANACLAQPACVSKTGRLLGVDFLLTGVLTRGGDKSGDQWALALSLWNVRHQRAVSENMADAVGLGDVLGALPNRLRALLAKRTRLGQITFAAIEVGGDGVSFRVDGQPQGPQQPCPFLQARTPWKRRWRGITRGDGTLTWPLGPTCSLLYNKRIFPDASRGRGQHSGAPPPLPHWLLALAPTTGSSPRGLWREPISRWRGRTWPGGRDGRIWPTGRSPWGPC